MNDFDDASVEAEKGGKGERTRGPPQPLADEPSLSLRMFTAEQLRKSA